MRDSGSEQAVTLGTTIVSRPARFLLCGQIGFFVSLAVCVLIDPEGVRDNHGWSYYEGRAETLLPYLLGVLVFVSLTLYAASLLERSEAHPALPLGLRLLTAFLFLDVATPDTVNAFFYWAHNLTSTLLFLYELGFAVWVVWVVWRTRLGIALVTVQFLGGLVAMFSQLQVISHLGLGILLFQLSFGALLVAATARVRVAAGDAVALADEAPATVVSS